MLLASYQQNLINIEHLGTVISNLMPKIIFSLVLMTSTFCVFYTFCVSTTIQWVRLLSLNINVFENVSMRTNAHIRTTT